MSTVAWLPSTGTAAVSPTPSATDWDGHVNTVSRPLNFTNGGSALATLTYSPDGADHLVDVRTMAAQFVSQVLPPQTIAAQTIALYALVAEAAASNNLFTSWKLYAVSVDGTTVLGTLVAVRNDGTENATSLTGRFDSATSTLFSSTVPFRLVLEVGWDGLPVNTATDTHNGTIRLGETIGANLVQDADTGDAPPMLLFANDLVLAAVAAGGQLVNGGLVEA